MPEFLDWFLLLSIGFRLSILLTVPLVLWWIFGRLIISLLAIIPFGLKRIFLLIYLLLEMPISALHKMFGSAFFGIDQGLAIFFNKISSDIEKIYKLLHKSKKVYGGQAFLIYIILSIYLIIPSLINLNTKPFTFWQDSYLNTETKIVESLSEKDIVKVKTF